MKAYCVVTISRQVNGEAVGVRFDKCFTDLAKAQAHVNSLAKTMFETVATPQGQVQFSCERGLHEIEVEE